MRAAIGGALGFRTVYRAALLVTLALIVGLTRSPAAQAQVFSPQPPSDVSGTRAQVCRPAAPAVEKTPGRSVAVY
jgi:hypothetical protein